MLTTCTVGYTSIWSPITNMLVNEINSINSAAIENTQRTISDDQSTQNYPSKKSSPIIKVTTPTIQHRRSSSSQKLNKLINALTPCRGRVMRRSHSFGTVRKVDPARNIEAMCLNPFSNTEHCNDRYSPPRKIHTLRRLLSSSVNLDKKSIDEVNSTVYFAPSTCSSCLDLSTTEVNANVLAFRRRWPESFITLIANYLSYLLFTQENMESIRGALVKETKHVIQSTSAEEDVEESEDLFEKIIDGSETNFSGCSFPGQKVISSRELKNNKDKQRFIFRRPGNQSTMDRLERALFPPRKRPLSVSLMKTWANEVVVSSEVRISAVEQNKLTSVLNMFDPITIACLLSRVLRRQGEGLFPVHLRALFLQLIDQPNEVRRRRASRLLFQLFPRQTLRFVVRPLFHLLACVASEPQCEVDPTSLAVLFAPILFADRATTTPATLVNPLPGRAVEMLVRIAQCELRDHASVDSLFHVPVLFARDCAHNLESFASVFTRLTAAPSKNSEQPPLTCSLKYCVTMIPSPPSLHSNTLMTNSQDNKVLQTKALHSSTLDFRVRRTPNRKAVGPCAPSASLLNETLLGVTHDEMWSS